jgi:hypothetical protein
MPRFVDKEQIAGVVKVLSLEAFYPELQLNFVVTQFSRIQGSLAEVQRNLLRGPEGQRHGFSDWHIALGSIIVPAQVTHRVLGPAASL